MKLIGLTGGIGMGKSACAQLLRQRAIPVVDTDDLARSLTAPGQPALVEIAHAFGSNLLDADGCLRRDKLADLVFHDAAKLKQLEAILHPRITAAWREQVTQWRQEGKPSAVVVIPLLYETGAESSFDQIVCVACSAPTQRRRLLSRGWSDVEVNRRLAAQAQVEEKISRAHRVIWSEGELPVLAAQLDQVDRKSTRLNSSHRT